MSGEVWDEVYDRLAQLIREHRTTLIFVNTRRLAERVAATWANASVTKTSPRITAAWRANSV